MGPWSIPTNRAMPRCSTPGRDLLCFRTTAYYLYPILLLLLLLLLLSLIVIVDLTACRPRLLISCKK